MEAKKKGPVGKTRRNKSIVIMRLVPEKNSYGDLSNFFRLDRKEVRNIEVRDRERYLTKEEYLAYLEEQLEVLDAYKKAVDNVGE